MGSLIKKAARLGNKASPHTWIVGSKASAKMDFGGQILGAWDRYYQPETPDAPPSPIVDNEAYVQRDRIRRMAKKAQGRDSTIRAGSLARPYTDSPASLLGS